MRTAAPWLALIALIGVVGTVIVLAVVGRTASPIVPRRLKTEGPTPDSQRLVDPGTLPADAQGERLDAMDAMHDDPSTADLRAEYIELKERYIELTRPIFKEKMRAEDVEWLGTNTPETPYLFSQNDIDGPTRLGVKNGVAFRIHLTPDEAPEACATWERIQEIGRILGEVR